MPGVGTLNNASRTTGVVVKFLAETLLVPVKNRLASDLGGALKATSGEVAGRQATGLVHNVDQHGCTISVETTLGLCNIMGAQSFRELLGPLLKQGLVSNGDTWGSFAFRHDELDPFTG